MVDLHSSREAGSAQGPPSATERRECKSRVTLLLRDADSGQIDHMAAEPTHGPHHPFTSSSWLRARGPFFQRFSCRSSKGAGTKGALCVVLVVDFGVTARAVPPSVSFLDNNNILVLILTRHTLARAGLANRPY